MRRSTEETIRRGWARLLDLEEIGEEGRTLRVVPDADSVSFVRIFGHGVLSGPQWALDRAANLSDDELALLPVLMRLARDHGARPLGAAELSYTDERVEHAELPITQDEAAVAQLEAACSHEDVDEVGLSDMPHRWVLLDAPVAAPLGSDPVTAPSGSVPDAVPSPDTAAPGTGAVPTGFDTGAVPLAGSGYVIWADTLAHMGVLTSPKARGRGYGMLAAAVGTNAALDAGLIPQWRVRWDNEASKRVAQVLGYELVGTQTTVCVDPD